MLAAPLLRLLCTFLLSLRSTRQTYMVSAHDFLQEMYLGLICGIIFGVVSGGLHRRGGPPHEHGDTRRGGSLVLA